MDSQFYEFHELSDEAKEKARAWFRETIGDWDWYEFVHDDLEEICRILGVALESRPVPLMGGGTWQKPCIYFSGFWSQGDGACFEGTYTYERPFPALRRKLRRARGRPRSERSLAEPRLSPGADEAHSEIVYFLLTTVRLNLMSNAHTVCDAPVRAGRASRQQGYPPRMA